MTTMAELKQGAHNSALVRKILSSVAFYAPYSAEMPTSYFSTGGVLAPAPTGFNPLGMTEKDDAFTFASDTDTEEVEAHGYSSAVRVDITKTTRTVASTFLETRKETLELATGTDLSNVTIDANGAIEIVESETSARPYGRLVIIGADGVGEDEWFFIREYPRVQITEVSEQSWGTSALSYGLTWTAYPDPELGFSGRQFIGGPAAAKNLEAMGFTAA